MKLTREKVLAMESGRELDRLVGGVVMGLDLVEDTLPQLPKYYIPEYERTLFRGVPLYSSDISAAWEAKQKIRGYPFDHPIRRAFYDNIAELSGGDYTEVEPHHIAKAALLAVMNL